MENRPIFSAEITANPLRDRFFAQTFTMQMVHVSMVSDLVARGIGKNASEVVRMAIEAFYKTQEVVEA